MIQRNSTLGAKFQFWRDEKPEIPSLSGPILEEQVNVGCQLPSISDLTPKYAAVEYHKLGNLAYGLLGATFLPASGNVLRLRVITQSPREPWTGSAIAGIGCNPLVGLSSEYTVRVMDVLKRGSAELGAGDLTVDLACESLVESNQLSFHIVSAFLVACLASAVGRCPQSDIYSEGLLCLKRIDAFRG